MSIWDSWDPIRNRPVIDVEQDIEPPNHIDHESAYVSPFETRFNILASESKIPPTNPFRMQGFSRAPKFNDDPYYASDIYFTRPVYKLTPDQKERAAQEAGVSIDQIGDYDTTIVPEDIYWPPNLAVAQAAMTYPDGQRLSTTEGLFDPRVQARAEELVRILNNPATTPEAFDRARQELDQISADKVGVQAHDAVALYEGLANSIVKDELSAPFVLAGKKLLEELKQTQEVLADLQEEKNPDQEEVNKVQRRIDELQKAVARQLYQPANLLVSKPSYSLPYSTTLDQDYANIAEYLQSKGSSQPVTKLFKEEYKTDISKAKTRAETMRDEKLKDMMRITDPLKAEQVKEDIKDLDLIIKFYGSKKWETMGTKTVIPHSKGSLAADINAAYAGGDVLSNMNAAALIGRNPLQQSGMHRQSIAYRNVKYIPETLSQANRSVEHSELEKHMIKNWWDPMSDVHEQVMGNEAFLIERTGGIGYQPRNFFPQFRHHNY